MPESRKPDFFVIGAPRCGTTAMCHYLAEHPKIAFSDPKEPFYFGQDFGWRITMREDAYPYYFRNAEPEHEAVGEGTVYYLFSQSAVSEILEYNPKSRFVVMLRNPAEMVQSFHAQLLVAGQEDVEDFAEAWRLQDARANGERLPRANREPQFLQYRKWGLFGEQLERLFAQVERERVCVVIFDDFAADPGREYERVLSFLGIESDGRAEFPRVLANRAVGGLAYRFVRYLLQLAFDLRRAIGWEHPKFQILKRVRDFSERLLARKADRESISPELDAELRNWFRADVEKLSKLLGRDLTHWSNPPTREPAAADRPKAD